MTKAVIVSCLVLFAVLGVIQTSVAHQCAHSKVTSDVYSLQVPGHAIANKDLWRRSSTVTRSMKQQSYPPTGWHTMRISVDYTFADDPRSDKYVNGLARTCAAAGDQLKIGGNLDSSTNCMDANGTTALYTNYCVLTCRAQDVILPSSTLQTKLREVINNVIPKFQSFLSVADTVTNQVTVRADESTNNCGDLVIANHTAATDFKLYVTLRPLQMLGETLAFAKTCQIDWDTGRPILGHMNVAPTTLINNADLDTVLLHELTHALGFSPSLLQYMRHPSDRTKTYMQYDKNAYPTGPIAGDGVSANTTGNNDIKININQLGPGKTIKIISPNVVSWGRTFFGCNTLNGVEWENGGGAESSTASHWEKRILYYEYMTSTQNALSRGIISGATLNFFQDTGFYEVLMSHAEPMDWGANGGCSWVTGDCGQWPDNYKCNTLQPTSQTAGGECGYNRYWSGACNLNQYIGDLPAGYQHVTGQPAQGGSDVFADRCPIVSQFVASGFAKGNCTNPSNYPLTNNPRHVWTGYSSRCFMSGISDPNAVAPLTAVCQQIVCQGSTPWVLLKDSFYPCRSDGEVIELLVQTRSATSVTADPPTPSSSGVTGYVSHSLKGTFQCGQRLAALCSTNDVLTHTAWPTLSTITPSKDTVIGGALITVTGTGFEQCYGIKIGNNWVTNITKVSNSIWTMNVPPTGTSGNNGGPGLNGEGMALVELWCNISGSCPNGCAVNRLTNTFNYTEEVVAPFSAADWFKDFIGTPIGKAVGGGIGAILLILLIIVVKSFCEGGDDDKNKKKKKRGQKGQRKRPPGQERGMLQAPQQPMYAQPQSRMQQYEDDLL